MSESVLAEINNHNKSSGDTSLIAEALGWVGDNVVHPAVNTAAIEPWNALAGTVNLVGRHTIGQEMLTRCDLLEVPQSKFLSPQWCVQSISSGLAMVVPYGIAGKATGGSLRSFGKWAQAEGTAAQFLKSEKTASILGAAIYDGLRETRPGETHVGNALGGAAGFFIFEHGNALSRNVGTMEKIQARVVTGVLGASAQHSVAHMWS
ncbi:MAG: hypothetical protein HY711_05255, partial [Candidatus Melainabacteria bacterium]|nr:hypothetical protein [Candidatus Melainabacteria bacterium]